MANIGLASVLIVADIKSFNKSLGDAERAFKRSFGNIANFSRQVGQAFTVAGAGILGVVGAVTKAASDFEDAFTGVRKTVDATEAEFASLSEGLLDMSTRIPQSAADLARIMEVAGQLGIRGVDNLMQFTETIAMLQDTTNILGEQGALSLARFMNIMGTAEGDVDRLGSTLVELGNNFAAQEAEILDIGMNLAAFGRQLGLTETQVLALATTIAASGGEAASASTAFQKIGLTMKQSVLGETDAAIESLKMFADIAGMSAGQFKALFQRDAMGALTAFLQGLANMEAQGKDTAGALEQLGLADQRLIREVSKVTGNMDDLRGATETAARGFRENTALAVEAEKRYSTLSSQIKLAWNEFKRLAIVVGDPFLKAAVATLREWIPVLSGIVERVGEWIKTHQELAGTLAIAIPIIGAVLVALGGFLIVLPSMIAGFFAISGAITGFIGILTGLGPIAMIVWTAIVAGLAWLASNWREVWLNIQIHALTVMEWMVREFSPAWEALRADIAAVMAWLREWVPEAWNWIVEQVKTAGGALVAWFKDNWPLIKETVKITYEAMKGATLDVVSFIRTHWELIRMVAETIWFSIVDVIKVAWEMITMTVVVWMLIVTGEWQRGWEMVRAVGESIWNVISEGWNYVLDGIVASIRAWVPRAVGALRDGITSLMNMWGAFANEHPFLTAMSQPVMLARAAGYLAGQFEGRASGGPVFAGQPYMVGERGPELFVPGQSGWIMNQQQLAGMGGGGNGVTININGGDVREVERTVRRVMYDWERMGLNRASRMAGA